MLSLQGWINGLAASAIIIWGCMFGLFYIYKSRKLEIRLLFYFGLCYIFLGLGYLGDCVDFLVILLTGKNLGNPNGLHALLCFMWTPFLISFAMYIGAKLLIPGKKLYLLTINVFLGIFYELIIFTDPIGSFTVIYPQKSGEDLLDVSINVLSPVSVILLIYFLLLIFFNGFGFLIKSIKSIGVIRKKFLLLLIGQLFALLFSSLDGFVTLGFARPFVRIAYISAFSIMYLGIREEPEKIEKISSKKEVKVEEGLFRLYKKPDNITEEEVTFHREKKICLICKSQVGGFLFMCTKCNALYCGKCAQALTNLENACWACNTPIDPSKPVKPYIESEEKIDLEILDMSQKKPKITKDPSEKNK